MIGKFRVHKNGELIAECDNVIVTEGHNRLMTILFDKPVTCSGNDTLYITYELEIE